MKEIKRFEQQGIIRRDRTSYGNQFSVEFDGDQDEAKFELKDYENSVVKVIVEIEIP